MRDGWHLHGPSTRRPSFLEAFWAQGGSGSSMYGMQGMQRAQRHENAATCSSRMR